MLVHALTGAVTAREQRLLSSEPRSISGILLWELAKLVQLGRLEMDLEHPDTIRVLAAVQVLRRA